MPRYRIFYSKTGPIRYSSHLDMVRMLERAMRRAQLPLAYSEGFNPHPRFSFAAPLPVGSEGLAEPFEVDMTEPVTPVDLEGRLNDVLPAGILVHGAVDVPERTPSLMSVMDRAAYTVRLDAGDLPGPLPQRAVEDFLALERIEVSRRGKDKREKVVDIRPGIIDFEIIPDANGVIFNLELVTGGAHNTRPGEVLGALFRHLGLAVDTADLEITRTRLFAG